LLLALPAALLAGLLLEVLVFRHLYARDHLSQVLATFGVILFLNQGVKLVWGAAPLQSPIPVLLEGGVENRCPACNYPLMPHGLHRRPASLVAGGTVVAGQRAPVIGMLVRAGADDREMVDALGVDIQRLFTLVFGLGALLLRPSPA
jgi:branched-chain amino acid transport system permease protein